MAENIHLRVTAEKKDAIRAHAQSEGLTLSAYILTAVNDRMRQTELKVGK